MFDNLALSGGSNKGYCYIGVLKALQESDVLSNIKNFSGASIGSFFATLFCMGFTYEELISFINVEIEVNDVNIDNLLNKYGFTNGDEIIESFKKVISLKYNSEITFKELYDKIQKTLTISASNLNICKVEYFNHEKTPNMKIIDAIRLSITIPYIFTSNKHNDNHYIDGAIFEKIPLKIFDKDTKTIGFVLISNIDTVKDDTTKINSLEDYTYNLLSFIKNKIQQQEYNENTEIIKIKTESINPLIFNISRQQKIDLIKNSYLIVKNKIKLK